MEHDFYKSKLIEKGIEVIIPNDYDRILINETIYNELCLGIISQKSKISLLNIVNRLAQEGAEGVILGCTEIGLLLKQEDTKTVLYDTTLIHAKNAALIAIGK